MNPSKNESGTAKKALSLLKEAKEHVKNGRKDMAVQVVVKGALAVVKGRMGKKKEGQETVVHQGHTQSYPASGENQGYANTGQTHGGGAQAYGGHIGGSNGQSTGNPSYENTGAAAAHGGSSQNSYHQGNHGPSGPPGQGGHQEQSENHGKH